MAKKKKVGVIGSGQVGKVLAAGFLKHGYEVMIGTREPSKLEGYAEEQGLKVGTFELTAAFGEIVVLATAGRASVAAIALAGPANLEGKTVLDATNPIAEAPPEDGVLKFFTSLDESLMEQLQAKAPGARFVKAWNSVGNAFFVNPELPGGRPTMFICGNHEGAKAEAAAILDQFGWDAVDMGTAKAARAIEPLCMLWCIPGFRENSWTHAFKLLRL